MGNKVCGRQQCHRASGTLTNEGFELQLGNLGSSVASPRRVWTAEVVGLGTGLGLCDRVGLGKFLRCSMEKK